MPRLIHVDTDIGGDTDDLCALALLLGLPDVELTGITTCTEAGRVRAAMAAYVLRLAGRTGVPVAEGASGSLAGLYMEPGIPDLERFWPEPLPPLPAPPGAALDLLAQSIARGATIVAIGPFTNLALLEAARPGLLASAELVLMGGHVTPLPPGVPNWGPDMDYNVQQDTIAARTVFEHSDPLIVQIPVTLQVHLREAHLPRLRAAGPLGDLIAHQSELYAALYDNQALGRRHAALPNDLLNFQHDPLACAVAVGWDGVRIEQLPLQPVMENQRLRFVVSPDGKPTRVVTGVDAEAFAELFLNAVEAVGRSSSA